MKTKTEVRHTPLPWKLGGINKRGNTFIVSEKTNEKVLEAIFFSNGLNDLGDVENAVFTVRAVNSHEALLEAAKKALEYLDQLPLDKTTGDPLPPFAELKKAIAQAEGDARP